VKFRKKPVVIEAIQFTGENAQEIMDFTKEPKVPRVIKWQDGGFISIETLEGTMLANKGDWIICGIKGEFYPCKPDIFEATYEPAE